MAAAAKKIQRKRLRTIWKIFILSVLAIAIGVIEQQMIWNNENRPLPECDGLKFLIMLLSIATGYLVVQKKKLLLQEQQVVQMAPSDKISIWNCHLTKEMLTELAFNLICAPPFVHMEYTYRLGSSRHNVFAYYTLDGMVTVFICMRVYHFFPLFCSLLMPRDAASAAAGRMREHRQPTMLTKHQDPIALSKPTALVGKRKPLADTTTLASPVPSPTDTTTTLLSSAYKPHVKPPPASFPPSLPQKVSPSTFTFEEPSADSNKEPGDWDLYTAKVILRRHPCLFVGTTPPPVQPLLPSPYNPSSPSCCNPSSPPLPAASFT
jgi:hypothetical protein